MSYSHRTTEDTSLDKLKIKYKKKNKTIRKYKTLQRQI